MKTFDQRIKEHLVWGGFCVFEEEMLDPQKAQRASDMGMDFGYVGFDQSHEKAHIMLDNAEKAGFLIFAHDPRLSGMPADRAFQLERAIADYKDHPALMGITLRDEPGVYDFQRLHYLQKAMKKAMPGKICGINLYPIYANGDQLNHVSYETYVNRFAEKLAEGIISYDFYPLYGAGQPETWLQDNYLRNFEIVARACQRKGCDMWYFIQNLAFNHILRDPTEEDVRWQVFCALSFGAKVIQLFTYGTPGNGDETFEDSIIDRQGNATFRYNMMKKLIAEFNGWTGVYMPYHWAGAMTCRNGLAIGARKFDVVFPGNIIHKRKLMGSYMDLDHPLDAFDPVKSFTAETPLLMGCFEQDGKKAFTLVNMEDPGRRKAVQAHVTFEGKHALRIHGQQGTTELSATQGWEPRLDVGEGLFVEILD